MMLSAKIEQTDDRLVITRQRAVIKEKFAYVALPLAWFLGWLIFIRFARGTAWDFPWTLPFGVFLIVGVIAAFAQTLMPQWPAPELVFDKKARRISRDGHFIGLFSNIMQVRLLISNQQDGRWFRLTLILTNFDEWEIMERPIPLDTSTTRLTDFCLTPWHPYPAHRRPEDAAEYELVMLANLIHDCLGLPKCAESPAL